MNVPITYRQVRDWPAHKHHPNQRKPSKFRVTPFKAMDGLSRELEHLGARECVIYAYFRDKDFNRSGGVYADAKPTEPGVMLEYTVGKDQFQITCDSFPDWYDNVRAIGLSLQHLRSIDRYGVTTGQQYVGFKKIAATSTETMTTNGALQVICAWSGEDIERIRGDGEGILRAVRRAKAAAHPDRPSGSHDAFVLVQQAAEVLGAAG